MASLRAFTATLAIGFLVVLAGSGGGSASPAGVTGDSPQALARSLDGRITRLRQERLEQAAIQWRGGPIVTSTGETVTVRVSDALPPEQVAPETWAEFLSKLVHGSELALLDTYLAPYSEVQRICGLQALGCYSRDRAISIGETLSDGTTPDEVIRHEYGHHIALHRSNTPWVAVDWGPKRWASAVNVCAKVARKQAFPGNEASEYARNPGEAWAEAYRLLNERKAGIPDGNWEIVAPSFYPDETALTAAEQDVLEPWTANQTSVKRRPLMRKGQVWWVPLSTPLDGTLAVTVTLPKGGTHDASLVAGNKRTVLKRGQWVRQRAKRITGEVCGQRSLYVKVTQKGGVGPVTVTTSTP